MCPHDNAKTKYFTQRGSKRGHHGNVSNTGNEKGNGAAENTVDPEDGPGTDRIEATSKGAGIIDRENSDGENKLGGGLSIMKSIVAGNWVKTKGKLNPNKPFLPIEIQLTILEKIKDTKTLMTCRLVNWDWNAAANQKLEKINLAQWKTKMLLFKPQNLEIPKKCKLSTILYLKQKVDFAYINLPPALKKSSHRWNPFPAKSLTLWSTPKLKFWEKLIPRKSIEWDQFFVGFGSCLTTLTLVEIRIKCHYLHSILVNTPNLKALTFERVQHLDDKSHTKSHRKISNQTENFSKHLKYLRIYGDLPYVWLTWLLVKFGHQLVYLTLEGVCPALLVFSKTVLLKSGEFKIHHPVCGEFVVVVGEKAVPDLQYLTIRFDYNRNSDYNDISNFIACFERNLKHLYLNAELDELKNYFDDWGKNKVIFSNLKSLVLETSATVENWNDIVQSGIVLPVVPNIEKVGFVSLPEI